MRVLECSMSPGVATDTFGFTIFSTRAVVLTVISYFSLSETPKVVLSIRNFSICTGTTAHTSGVRSACVAPVVATPESKHTPFQISDERSADLHVIGAGIVVELLVPLLLYKAPLYTRKGSKRGNPQSTIMYHKQNTHTHSVQSTCSR